MADVGDVLKEVVKESILLGLEPDDFIEILRVAKEKLREELSFDEKQIRSIAEDSGNVFGFIIRLWEKDASDKKVAFMILIINMAVIMDMWEYKKRVLNSHPELSREKVHALIKRHIDLISKLSAALVFEEFVEEGKTTP